jgi:hypothetical protein
MNTLKNRNHRACANVEGYLNYTKLNHFWLPQLAEKAARGEAKAGARRLFARFPQVIFGQDCAKRD